MVCGIINSGGGTKYNRFNNHHIILAQLLKSSQVKAKRQSAHGHALATYILCHQGPPFGGAASLFAEAPGELEATASSLLTMMENRLSPQCPWATCPTRNIMLHKITTSRFKQTCPDSIIIWRITLQCHNYQVNARA